MSVIHSVHGILKQSFIAHYCDVIMSTIASQITSLTFVYATVYSDVDQRKHQSSASLAFVRGIHREPVNTPRKGPVTQKMLPFGDVIMIVSNTEYNATLVRLIENVTGGLNSHNWLMSLIRRNASSVGNNIHFLESTFICHALNLIVVFHDISTGLSW